jgi:hypothetical protein
LPQVDIQRNGVQHTMALTCSLESTSTPLAWLIPDVAMLVSVLTLFFCLFLFSGTTKLFRDSDSGWHIRTGEAILDGRGLPRTDPYSLLRNGQPWFAWEWGSDAAVGLAHRMDGLSGVALLYGVAIAACTWLWFRLHWAVGGNFLFACGMATLMISTADLHWLARPHVFSWVLMLGAIWWAESMREVNWKTGVCIGLFGALWANLHASFLLAPVIGVVYAVAHLLRPLIWKLDRTAEWSRARFFAIASGCALAGSFANPYGWRLHQHVLAYLANKELLDRIGEFQSFNFRSEGATQILLTVGVAAIGGVLALGQKKLAHFLLSAILIALALRSARGLPLVALALLPFANGAITDALRDTEGLQPKLRRAIQDFLNYSANLRWIDAKWNGWALVPLVLLFTFAVLHTPAVLANTGFPPDEFPVAAATQIEKLPSNIRLLAPDKFGGYLIYRFNGSRRVYFDGRSDFYGLDYMKSYLRLIEVRPGWEQLLDEVKFTHALLPNRYSLIPALQHLGWKRLYSDNAATLLEKP